MPITYQKEQQEREAWLAKQPKVVKYRGQPHYKPYSMGSENAWSRANAPVEWQRSFYRVPEGFEEYERPAGITKWRPEYQPTWWENPVNVARAYHQYKALKPGDEIPNWYDERAIESAYQYFKFANRDKPWWEWKHLHPSDPGRGFLQSIGQPDLDYVLPPDQYQAYAMSTLAQQTPDQWDPKLLHSLPPDQQRYLDQYAQQLAQQTPWEELPSWQRLMSGVMSSPVISGVATMAPFAAMGAAGGMAAGPLGVLLGAGVPLALGAGLGYAASRSPTAADLMMKLDIPAEWLERSIGFGYQAIGSLVDPEQYGTFEEVINNVAAARQAGSLTYAADMTTIPNILPAIEYLVRDAGFLGGQPEIIKFAKPGEVWHLGQKDPVKVDAYGLAALTQIRREIMSGRDGQEVIDEWTAKLGFNAQINELVGHMVLDPLNVVPHATTKGVGLYGRLAGDVAMARAFESTPHFTQAWRKYGDFIRSNLGGQYIPDELSAFQRFAAGLNELGIPKELAIDPVPTNPIKRAFHHIFGLTPDAQARQFIAMQADAWDNAISVHGKDPTGNWSPDIMVELVDRVAKQEPRQVATLSADLGSTIMYTGQRALQGIVPKLKTLLEQYHSADSQRALLNRLTDIMKGVDTKITQQDILLRLGNVEDADIFIQQLKNQLELADPQLAAELRATPDFTAENVKLMMDAFTGEDPIPWHPQEFGHKASQAIASGMSEWSTKAYGAAPAGPLGRFVDTLKRAQTFLLLGWNPNYAINNEVSNTVHRAATGVWGYTTNKVIDDLILRWGVEPYRFEAGVGIAAIAPEAAMKAAPDSGIGKPIGAVGVVEAGEMPLRQATRPPKGMIDPVKNTIDSANKYAAFSNLSRWFEVQESRQTWYQAIVKTWNQLHVRGKGFQVMSPHLKNMLIEGGVNPEYVYRLIEGSMHPDELTVKLGNLRENRRLQYDLDQILPDIARELGYSLEDTRDLISPLATLRNDISSAKSNDDIIRIFNDVKNQMEDLFDEALANDLRTRIDQVVQQVKAGGFTEFARIMDDYHWRVEEHWLHHFEEWENTFQLVEQMKANGASWEAIQTQFKLAAARANRAWRRIDEFQKATIQGSWDALGARRDITAAYLSKMDDIRSIWREYFNYKSEAYSDLYSNRDLDRVSYAEAKAALELELNERYNEANIDAAGLAREGDDMYIDIITQQFGDDVGDAAKAWRDHVRGLDDVRRGIMTEFRETSIGMDVVERRRYAKQFFGVDPNNPGDYIKAIQDYLRGEAEGPYKIWRTATGEEMIRPTRPPEEPPPAAAAGEVPPEEPPPVAPPPEEPPAPAGAAADVEPSPEELSAIAHTENLRSIADEYDANLYETLHVVNKYLRGEYGDVPERWIDHAQIERNRFGTIEAELARDALDARRAAKAEQLPPIDRVVPIEEPPAAAPEAVEFIPPEEVTTRAGELGITPEEIEAIRQGQMSPEQIEEVVSRVTRPREPITPAGGERPVTAVPRGTVEPGGAGATVGGAAGAPRARAVPPPAPGDVGVPEYLRAIVRPDIEYEIKNPKVKKILIEEIGQQTDLRRIFSNYQRGNRGYLLSNGTGTGKSYVGMGTIVEGDYKNVLIGVPGPGQMIEWKKAAKLLGKKITTGATPPKEGIFMTTYNWLSKPNNRAKLGAFDYIIYDETHKLKGSGAWNQGAMSVLDANQTAPALFTSATPFQSAADMHYLERLGLWDVDDPLGFPRFLRDHNYTWIKRNVGPGFWRFDGTVEDILDIYRQINEKGIGSTRRLVIDQPFDNQFTLTPAYPEHATLYRQVDDTYKNLMASVRGMQKAQLSSQRTLALRRILEMSKIDETIRLTKEMLAEGRQVAIFTGFKGDIKPPVFKKKLSWVNGTLRDLYANISRSEGRTVERLVEALGGREKVAVVIGDIKDVMRELEINDYQTGKKKVVVATVATGGTGLSLHDTTGNAPRAQINMYLPWSGLDFEQVYGRSYRLGSKSGVKQFWLFSDQADEARIVKIVAGRVQEMGGLVKGIEADVNASKMMAFDFGLTDSEKFLGEILDLPEERRPQVIEGEAAPAFPTTKDRIIEVITEQGFTPEEAGRIYDLYTSPEYDAIKIDKVSGSWRPAHPDLLEPDVLRKALERTTPEGAAPAPAPVPSEAEVRGVIEGLTPPERPIEEAFVPKPTIPLSKRYRVEHEKAVPYWTKTGSGADALKPSSDVSILIFENKETGRFSLEEVSGNNVGRAEWFDRYEDARKAASELAKKYTERYAIYDVAGSRIESFQTEESAIAYARRELGLTTIFDELSASLEDAFNITSSRKSKNFAYRGIHSGEYQEILRTRRVQSDGRLNLSTEAGYTMFGEDPLTAHTYATNFAPKEYRPTVDTPTYVIEVKKSEGFRSQKETNYLYIEGGIPASDINRVIEIRLNDAGDDYIYKDVTADFMEQTTQPERPAAAPAPEAQPITVTPTRRTTALGADPTKSYEFDFELVDLDQLVTSHNEMGEVNPAFPEELQPRIRDRRASTRQMQRIAAELEPGALLVDTHRLDSGPMIVGPDNVVESGNGRAVALRIAREMYPDNYAAYIERLREILPQYGIDPAEVEGMTNPVLVRRRTSDVDRVQFAAEANQASVMRMSAFEQAIQDAKGIPDAVLSRLEIGATQSIDEALNSTANRDLARAFVDAMPENEQAALLDAQGNLSRAGLERLKTALFAKTYPGEAGRRLLQAFSESIDTGIKNFENAMYASLPDMARAEGAIRAGQRATELSLANDISSTVSVYHRLRSRNMSVTDYLAQLTLETPELNDFQRALLGYISENARYPKRLREMLIEYSRAVMEQAPAGQMEMIPGVRLAKGEILENVVRQLAPEEELPLFAGLEGAPTGPPSGEELARPLAGGGEAGRGGPPEEPPTAPPAAAEPERPGWGRAQLGDRIETLTGDAGEVIEVLPDAANGAGRVRIRMDDGQTKVVQGMSMKIVQRAAPAPALAPERLEPIVPEVTPETAPALGAIPPGVLEDVMSPYFRTVQDYDHWQQKTTPVVDSLREKFLQGAPPELTLGNLNEGARQELGRYLQAVRSDMASERLATMRWAENLRDQALLNYSKRRGLDNILTPLFPYQFWYTRSMFQWALRAIDRPKWFANYGRLRDFMRNSMSKPGFPSRLRDKMAIPAPFLPDWAGGQVWVDPVGKMFPFEEFSRPIDLHAQDKDQISRRAESILAQWVNEGKIDNQQMLQAMSRQGELWSRAVATAQKEVDDGDPTPFDFMDLILSPALYLTLPTYLATGKDPLTSREDIPLMPITRTGKSIQEITRNTPLHALGQMMGGLMSWPESAWRKRKGLSEFGDWGNYYVDRMLSNMAAEGYDTKEILMAMNERSGPLYEEALSRVRLETSLRTPGALPLYGALRGAKPGELAAAAAFGWLPSGLLPEGELEQRGLAQQWKLVREQYNKGDSEAYNRFLDEHPEYATRLALWDAPQDRLRQFLASEIWDSYSELSRVDKQAAKDQLGPLFTEAFMGSETGDYNEFDMQTLAYMANFLHGRVPMTDETATVAGTPDFIAYKLEKAPPDEAQAMDIYRQMRDQLFPNWYAMQSWYFGLEKGERKKFLARFPQLLDYWDWNKAYKKENPVVSKYTKKAEDIEPEYNLQYDFSFVNEFSSGLSRQLLSYYYSNRQLTTGAAAELRYIWEQNGRPGSDYKTFLDDVLRTVIAP